MKRIHTALQPRRRARTHLIHCKLPDPDMKNQEKTTKLRFLAAALQFLLDLTEQVKCACLYRRKAKEEIACGVFVGEIGRAYQCNACWLGLGGAGYQTGECGER